MKISNLALVGPAISAGHVTAHWTNIHLGQQIDPGQVVPGDLDLHVEQSAPENGTLTLVGKIMLSQWNEPWGICSEGQGQCDDPPEVSFDGWKVIMGTKKTQMDLQNTSVHGGSILLASGSSYDVTFEYDVCTWDYLWYDHFSVSTSPKPYWMLDLKDPISIPANGLPGLGWYWGFSGGHPTLECVTGSTTVNMPGYAGGTYLNVVLDTGTLPSANHVLPSYGTITIEEIVVNP